MARPRILIADDHKLVAEAFGKFIENECTVVGFAFDGRQLVEMARELMPDVAVLDIAMPLLNGIDAAERLKQVSPKIKIVVLTMNEDPTLAAELLRRDASAFLLKTSGGAELLRAVRDVMKGLKYVTPKIARLMEDEWVRNPVPEREVKLTARQREVLQLLAEGQTMKEVAATLRIATRTVAFHKYKIMGDFRLRSNAELVRLAIRERMLPAGPQGVTPMSHRQTAGAY
jgi:DNA-binding NarL/FixJ family response regulator